MTTKQIDINSDMGERLEALEDGTDGAILRQITSANIACGGHAGDEAMMEKTILLAKKYRVGIGAHPGYPDRKNFGRVEMKLSGDEIARFIYEQIRLLARIAQRLGSELVHVKPHGALYNTAVKDSVVAEAIAVGVSRWSKSLVLVGLADSPMLQVFAGQGLTVVGEAFADRSYESDGSLRSRKHTDALITDPYEAAARALTLIQKGTIVAVDGSELHMNAQTICIHSDTPNAPAIAKAVRESLLKAGVEVRPLTSARE